MTISKSFEVAKPIMEFKATCSPCNQTTDCIDELQGQEIDCLGCGQKFFARPIKQKFSPPSNFRMASAAALDPRRAGTAITCPFCKSHNISDPIKKMTTSGVIMFIAGLLLAPVCIGLVLVYAGWGSREVKHECRACMKTF